MSKSPGISPSFFLVLLMILALVPSYFILSYSQNDIVVDPNDFVDPENATKLAEAFLETHNEVRALKNIPPLQWNVSLEKQAARILSAMFSPVKLPPGDYGETFLACKPMPTEMNDPTADVREWAGGEAFYNYLNNSCDEFHEAPYSLCHEYLQVVWKNTTQLGCAQIPCSMDWCDTMFCSSMNKCLYYPSGNIQRESPY